MVFLGLFFEVLILLWFAFGVSGIVSKVLKTLVFPSYLGFSGVAYCCLFGFGRFRCFCVSCVCFPFLCCFCFCFVCFVIGFVVGCCCFGFFCVFFFCFLLFLFFFVFLFCWRVLGSGEVAQRATSLGPKPSLFYFFCFYFFGFCFLLFFCFPVFAFARKNLVFPTKEGHFLCMFFFFSVSPFVSL